MPGLYGFTANSNVSVNVGNTTGLYQQNTGNVYVVNNAVTLLNTLSQAGNVNFALTAGNSKVLAYTANIGTVAGSYGSTTTVPVVTVTSDGRVTGITTVAIDPGAPGFYSNANVQAYLPTYTGSLANSSSIISLQANAAAQQSNITNLDAQYTSLNSTVITQGGQIGALQTNAAIQQSQIDLRANIAGQIFTGNVQAPYFIGDGSQLTGIVGTYSNTNVSALLSSNTVSTITTTGNITTVANIVSPAYLYPNGVSILSGIGGTYSNTNVAAYLTTATIATTGNITAANLTTAGNVTGNYIKGNAELMTGLTGVAAGTYGSDTTIPTIVVDLNGRITQITTNAISGGGSYGNANVAAYLASNTGLTIITTGNITTTANIISPNYLYSNGVSILTGISGTYSNTNVAAYLTTATITTSGNITAANLTTAGNVQGAYVLGDGSLLTNLPVQAGTYSNTNVAAYLTTATISTTGNVTAANLTTAGNVQGAYVLGDGSLLTNLPVQAGTYSNTNVASYLTTANISTTGNITAGNLTTAGNVSGSYVLGDGSQLTNLPVQAGTYSNTNVASYLTTANISTSGNITGANLTTAGNVSGSYVLGDGSLLTNLPVQAGTYSNTNVASYLTTANISTSGNITAANLTTAGNVYGSYILGDGSLLTNLPVQAGTYSNTNVASYLTTATINTTGNLQGAYVLGDGSQLTNLPVQTATGSAGGSLTGSYPNPALATQSGITAGIFGDSITVPQITIAANGVATSASNVSIVFPVTSGFSGNLVGNTLTASGTGRILANAYPQANVTQISTYTQAVAVTATPSYTGANLNPANQTVVAAFNGNINFLTSWAAGTRTTIGTLGYLAVTATSANTAMNAGDRIRPLVGGMDLNLNGKSWGLMSSASNALLPIAVNGQTLNVYGTGNMGQAAGIGAAITITPVGGSINAQYATGNFTNISYSTAGATYTASNIQYARLYTGSVTATANLTVANVIALHTYSGWTSSNVSLVNNAYALLNEDTRTIIQTAGNIVATTTSNVILGAGQMVSYRDKITALGTTSGSLVFDGTVAPSWTATLNGNITLNNSSFTNYASGASVTAIFTQDGTGSRILTSTQIKWAGASSTLSTAAGAIDIANFYYDGTTWYGSLVKGYA